MPQLEKDNTSKYLHPPAWQQIESFISELGVSVTRFEKFYGIPVNTLSQVKRGLRNLAPKYWSIIYERIKPAYGVGFIGEFTISKGENRIKKARTDSRTVKKPIKASSHSRLSQINPDQENKQ